MWRILGALLLFGLAIYVVKLAILVLVIAGLIFRTKETAGLLVFMAIVAGFSSHPAIGFSIVGVIAIVLIVRAIANSSDTGDPPPLSLPATDDD